MCEEQGRFSSRGRVLYNTGVGHHEFQVHIFSNNVKACVFMSANLNAKV